MNLRLPAYGMTPSDVYPGYGGYAGAPPPVRAQDALNAMMDNVLEALSRGLLSTKARAAASGAGVSPDASGNLIGAVSAAALDAAVGSGINKLASEDRNAVLIGNISGGQWVSYAQNVASALLTAAQALGDTPTLELVSGQLVKATTDAADIAAGRYGWPIWAWVLTAGAGAFVLWKVLGGRKVRKLADIEPEDALDGWD